MDTETLTVLPKGEDFEIIVQHDQTGGAYGIILSKNAYEQLRQHFVSGSLGFDKGYEQGYNDATREACKEIAKNYQPNDR